MVGGRIEVRDWEPRRGEGLRVEERIDFLRDAVEKSRLPVWRMILFLVWSDMRCFDTGV